MQPAARRHRHGPESALEPTGSPDLRQRQDPVNTPRDCRRSPWDGADARRGPVYDAGRWPPLARHRRTPMHVIPRVFARPLRFLCLLALVWSGLSVAEPALARAETAGRILIAFEYRAPTACMDEEQAFSLLHRRSRRVARTSPVLAQQHLRMSVVPDASGYRGVLTVTRAGQRPERRRMTGGSCDEVVEALALTAALSIDPDATVTLGPVEPSGAWGDD